MPKLVTRPPKYARHKPGGQAIAGINGRMIYLGPWGSEKSRIRYKQEVTKWADDQERSPTAPVTAAELLPESSNTLVVLAECLDHAEGYYVKDGKPTSMLPILRRMLSLWREMFGDQKIVGNS